MSIISDALKKAQERQAKSGSVKDLSGILSKAAAEKSEEKDMLGSDSSKRPVLIARIMLIVLLVGSVALLIVFAQYLKGLKTQTPTVAKKKTVSTPTKESTPTPRRRTPLTSRTRMPATAASQIKRAKTSKVGYPSRPSGKEIVGTTQVQYGIYERPSDLPALTGIMYTQTNPQAILGGEFVSEGSKVGGFTVKKILPDRVKVIYEKQEYEIRLR
jgi:hypothetical protein